MKPTNITTLPENPEHERHGRMMRYSIMMGIRMICFGLMFVTSGFWLAICAIGAIFLPYIAVMVANNVDRRNIRPTESPQLRLESGPSHSDGFFIRGR